MKVRELIAQLNGFDQDANVFILYDSCYAFPPSFRMATPITEYSWKDEGVRVGDAVCDVG